MSYKTSYQPSPPPPPPVFNQPPPSGGYSNNPNVVYVVRQPPPGPTTYSSSPDTDALACCVAFGWLRSGYYDLLYCYWDIATLQYSPLRDELKR
ncbi:hypothetical protein Gasu2_43470 [Galdieria sulphuraria]|nr:hypothetical protein Gasu2_43470 [Galdieria sulphuraria]